MLLITAYYYKLTYIPTIKLKSVPLHSIVTSGWKPAFDATSVAKASGSFELTSMVKSAPLDSANDSLSGSTSAKYDKQKLMIVFCKHFPFLSSLMSTTQRTIFLGLFYKLSLNNKTNFIRLVDTCYVTWSHCCHCDCKSYSF